MQQGTQSKGGEGYKEQYKVQKKGCGFNYPKPNSLIVKHAFAKNKTNLSLILNVGRAAREMYASVAMNINIPTSFHVWLDIGKLSGRNLLSFGTNYQS